MNMKYILGLLAGAVIWMALFAWKLRRSGQRPVTALMALPLAAVLGVLLAKVLYFILEFRDIYVTYDGFGGLLSTNPQEFSMIGGCLGTVLAVVLAAKLTGQKPMPVLDAFAPSFALMVASVRACEGLLEPMRLVGLGSFVMNEAHHFFPLAVEIEMLYSWFYAVFMLEALLALIVAAGSFAISHQGRFAPGRVFLHTVFFLALPQIFCEQLLGRCMAWGFVRIEQLLCALIVFGVILYAGIKRKRLTALVPAALCLVCAAVLIWMEFTLDNKLLFGIDLPTGICYAIMIASLSCMAGLSLYAFHRLNQARG